MTTGVVFAGIQLSQFDKFTLDVSRNSNYIILMILSYRDARTERFARGVRVKSFEPFRRQAENRLERLDAARDLADLAALPGNRLEKLAGNRKGQYSIRINDQWRICFVWLAQDPGPSQVEIVDYH
jgi:proteic killer suppression protein